MMLFRTLAAGCFAFFVAGTAAQAATGWTTNDLNLRAGPGSHYRTLTVMPAGARVDVIRCTSWCELYYAGYRGWASARYITTAYRSAPPVVRPPMPPTIYWYFGRPRWDDRYHSWHGGRHWWYGDRWHDRPHTGFYFEFGR
jgi:uncharacterized protein YraI